MNDKIYKNLNFTNEFSVDDWNNLIKSSFGKYFKNNDVFNANKELLHTEIINYIRFSENKKYLELFDWTFSIFGQCIELDEDLSIDELTKSFYETSDTDTRWMTNVITQPDVNSFEEHDKINYSFKLIDEILEGVFKPRFKLLHKFSFYLKNGGFPDNSNDTLGTLIKNFPLHEDDISTTYLKDSIVLISTNQWRNIAAHKSFKIEQDTVIVTYGSSNSQTVKIDYKQFYSILNWVQNIYRVIRLAEVLIYLNYTEKIVNNLGTEYKIRFESSLLHIIHNMQIVGFEFIGTDKSNKLFNLNFKKKVNENIKDSIIHASQCLYQLSCGIHDDEYIKNKFNRVRVNIYDDKTNMASASIEISNALKKVENKISLEEYIDYIDFKFNSEI